MKRTLLDTAWYLAAFLIIQYVCMMAAMIGFQTKAITPMVNIVSTLAASIITIALYGWRRWTPLNSIYLNTRPWFTLFWVVCLTIGAAIPLTAALDATGLQMPDVYKQMFKGMMHNDMGFIAIGVLVPIAEEMVFRGAILRRLLDLTGNEKRWIAIVTSAALFGLVHGNMLQGLNAFALGLPLGWMYVRTRSIVPGVVMHFTNNSLSYIMYRMYPGADDMTLREFYGGDMTRVWLSVVFSLMIFGAALYQLNMRLKKS